MICINQTVAADKDIMSRFNWLYKTFGRNQTELDNGFNGCIYFVGGQCNWHIEDDMNSTILELQFDSVETATMYAIVWG